MRSVRGGQPPSGGYRRGLAMGITRRAWIAIHIGFFAYIRFRAKYLYKEVVYVVWSSRAGRAVEPKLSGGAGTLRSGTGSVQRGLSDLRRPPSPHTTVM